MNKVNVTTISPNNLKGIPKYIHQINLLGCSKIPSKYTININSIRKFNEDWSYKCWSEKEIYDLCLQYSSNCAETFNAFCNHNKKILAKYIILFSFGGMYLDMDCTALKSFNTIPNLDSKDVILSYTPHDYLKNLILEGTLMRLLNISTIVSTANNIYIAEIIKNILTIDKKIHEAILVTKILVKYKNDPKVLLLDHRYFDSCHAIDSCCFISREAIVNHKYNYSWMNSWIVWLFGCVFHLKEIYDHIISCAFLLIILLILIYGST